MNSLAFSSKPRRPSGFGQLQQRRHRPDYVLLIISSIMLAIGLIVVYAISPALSAQKNVGENYYINKQLLAALVGAVAFIFVANTPVKWWRKAELPLLYSAAIATIAVRLFGDQVNGAYRWIQVGGFSFQAAELVKFAVLIWLAGFLIDRVRANELNSRNKTYKPLVILLLTVSLVVGYFESDLGSSAVAIAIMAAMVYIIGLPLKKIALIAGAVLIGTTLLIAGSSYRRDRLTTFLNPAQDCQNSGYQACQALITVGSGGIFGKGLGRGAQAYGYLPEAANDSIFAIYAEKFGFFGVAVLLGLFTALFTRLKSIMERAPDTYSRLLIAGILAWLSTQTIINVGAMIGLLPLKGITLPFISYGGTSVVFVMLVIGIAFQISRYTSYSIIKEERSAGNENDVNKTVTYRARA